MYLSNPKGRKTMIKNLFYSARIWLNSITSDEGCTTVDARKLKDYNFGLAMENDALKKRLRDFITDLEIEQLMANANNKAKDLTK